MNDTSGTASIEAPAARPQSRLRRWRLPLMILVPLAIIVGVAYAYMVGRRSETTENAYVQVAKTPVAPSIGGRVVEIYVHENQVVRRGQVLFRLDTRDLAASAAAARAQVATAQLGVAQARAAYARESANVATAEGNLRYANEEAARQQRLLTAGVASRQQADQARHAAETARDQLAAVRQARAQALAALGGNPDVGDQAPTVQQAQAQLQRAQLNMSYATVVAPADGIVARVDQMPVGAYLNASQTAFWLLSGRPWIEANFKEDQLAHMRIGQPVTISVDAYDGGDLKGRVASFAPATGAAFSMLPAQNATGNWVKVTQRLPVRIEFEGTPPDMATRAGLSAKVSVDIRSKAKPS